MVVFKSKSLYDKAAAWHDHGHENNPAVPRWEDTRSGSGFNYRMMELQGAVGLAQLRKLPGVVAAQRANRDRLWEAINDLPGIARRAAPASAMDSADALVFTVTDKATALACRAALLENGVSTKILPEATTWHFAGTWSHMPQLVAMHGPNLANAFPRSKQLLERAVSLPVTVRMTDTLPQTIRTALFRALSKKA